MSRSPRLFFLVALGVLARSLPACSGEAFTLCPMNPDGSCVSSEEGTGSTGDPSVPIDAMPDGGPVVLADRSDAAGPDSDAPSVEFDAGSDAPSDAGCAATALCGSQPIQVPAQYCMIQPDGSAKVMETPVECAVCGSYSCACVSAGQCGTGGSACSDQSLGYASVRVTCSP